MSLLQPEIQPRKWMRFLIHSTFFSLYSPSDFTEPANENSITSSIPNHKPNNPLTSSLFVPNFHGCTLRETVSLSPQALFKLHHHHHLCFPSFPISSSQTHPQIFQCHTGLRYPKPRTTIPQNPNTKQQNRQ